jgi:hypothetical protein
MKFVIFVNVNKQRIEEPEAPDLFLWEVRSFNSEGTGGASEKAGPVLVHGSAATNAAARVEAEAAANLLATEDAYVYTTP